MKTLQDSIEKTIDDVYEKYGDEISEEKFLEIVESVVKESIPQTAENILAYLKKDAPDMLEDRRSKFKRFEEINYEKWDEAFDLFEVIIVTCRESIEMLSEDLEEESDPDSGQFWDVLTRLHSKACLITNEINCLLKSGFPDGAHGRWRALHELNVITQFIAKHGPEAAARFYDHEIVDAYKGQKKYQKYVDKLNTEPLDQGEVDRTKKMYDEVKNKYGKNFKNSYGWASKFLDNDYPRFSDIEKDVNLDYWRPYYKWASQNIHANVKGLMNMLGLRIEQENHLLMGPSTIGLTVPAHSTAIALSQITSTLLKIRPNIDRTIAMGIIDRFTDDLKDKLVSVEN